jgi:DNA repair protein RadC
MSESGARAPYRTMRELASDDRPREKLLQHGPDALSDGEVLAIVLGSGMAGENVVDLARRVLQDCGGATGLARMDANALKRTKGLGPAKAAQVIAAIELGRRVQRDGYLDRPMLLSPQAVDALIGAKLRGLRKEILHVLALDTKGRLLGAPATVAGSLNAVAARTAEVFREAIILEARSVVLAHNHPSGDARPSPQDVAVTKALVAAGKLLDIEVMDHVVIGQGTPGYVSMAQEGLMRA